MITKRASARLKLVDKLDPEKLTLTPKLKSLLKCDKSRIVVCAPRRCYKTACVSGLAFLRIATRCRPDPPWKGLREYYFIGHSQANADSMREWFIRWCPDGFITDIECRQGFGDITLYDGTLVHFYSGNVTSITKKEGRAAGACGIVVDEIAYQKPEVVKSSLTPLLNSTNGWLIYCGTPKHGALAFGADWHRDMVEKWNGNDDPASPYASFRWGPDGILDPEVIEKLRMEMDHVQFQESVMGLYCQSSGSVAYSFGDYNLVEPFMHDPSLPVYVGSDFNVDHMSSVYSQYVDGVLCVFGEFRKNNCNARELARMILERFPTEKIIWTGDASGKSRSAATGHNCWEEIRQVCRDENRRVAFRIPNANPYVSDRVSEVNRALLDGGGNTHVLIGRDVGYLIADLQNLSYKPGTWQIDESNPERGHSFDAFSYILMLVRPGRKVSTAQPTSFDNAESY